MVYGVVLSDDSEVLISAIQLVFQYTECPKWYPYIELDYCVNTLTAFFSFNYRPFYYVAHPLRDYICIPICGNSGQNYTIT
ncbi:unnamed protein product [Caenorhabditis sp. 36 PRJEB53466]|nr:unnamed protein product [Caenorhabditis sp. 36 PRJEB53466]CAI2352791.1 unnamed protein product [Caenorhabditis sp. 36 PRJEB53466]